MEDWQKRAICIFATKFGGHMTDDAETVEMSAEELAELLGREPTETCQVLNCGVYLGGPRDTSDYCADCAACIRDMERAMRERWRSL